MLPVQLVRTPDHSGRRHEACRIRRSPGAPWSSITTEVASPRVQRFACTSTRSKSATAVSKRACAMVFSGDETTDVGKDTGTPVSRRLRRERQLTSAARSIGCRSTSTRRPRQRPLDFGGFLVKANSEGQPGPQDYDRTHADGANMLAEALAPHGGVVMWRAFVYSADNPRDRHSRPMTNSRRSTAVFAERRASRPRTARSTSSRASRSILCSAPCRARR